MKYTDADMKMMAIGEIGAHLMAIVIAVATWILLGADTPVIIKIPAAIIALLVSAKVSLDFIHIGYVPEQQEDRHT